jgi:acyl-CoA synthetase (AMP-forming)/AMP-acid ligase II
MYPEPVFYSLPQLNEYHTRDLFSKHPAKADLWRFQGRKDDLIALLPPTSKEPRLMLPVAIESAIMAHPDIKAALVLGNGEPRPILLIEPSEKFSELEHESRAQKLVQQAVMPILDEVNQTYPPYARIDRDTIVVMRTRESMLMNTKGYISRKLTTERFEAEISALVAHDMGHNQSL